MEEKKKYRPVYQSYKKVYKGLCYRLPYGVVCNNDHKCNSCDIYYNIRENKGENVSDPDSLLSWRHTIKATSKAGGADWYLRPLLLKPEAMSRVGLALNDLNQIVVAYNGSGMFQYNPSGMIDVYLAASPSRRYTFSRQDFYGVPNDAACEYYREEYDIKINNSERRCNNDLAKKTMTRLRNS